MHSVSFPRPNAGPPPPELHVSIVIGAAILVQTALALIWAGAASERLRQLEDRAAANAAMIERTTRLEERMRFVAEAVARIEDKIDQQTESAQ